MERILTRPEEEIKRNVTRQLFSDRRIDASRVQIEIQGGTVRLSGTVPSYAALAVAEADAFDARGVEAVDNRLEVAPPALPQDLALESAIRNLIRFNSDIDESGISIVAIAGKVFFEGMVPSFWDKVRVEALAAEIKGVTDIVNKLTVVPTVAVDDAAMAKAIISALDRTPGVEVTLINVEVEKGNVILSGSVADRVTRRAVEEAAHRTRGVVNVENRLVIEPARQD